MRVDWYNPKTQFYERVGPLYKMPVVYDMLIVRKGYFSTKATLSKNLEPHIIGNRTLYPAQFRYASQCYVHDYEIKDSATLKIKKLPKGIKTFEEYKALTGAKLTKHTPVISDKSSEAAQKPPDVTAPPAAT
jgi:hypothetical protein